MQWHLPLADAIASAAARRLLPLVEREDLIQVAREALLRSASCCRAGEPCLLDQLASPEAEPVIRQATALRLTLLEGLSLRAAAERFVISAMSVQRAQKKAIAALRLQLVSGG